MKTSKKHSFVLQDLLSNKKYLISILAIIIPLAGAVVGYVFLLKSSNSIDCKSSYDCLFTELNAGNSAKVTITEKLEDLSLEEKSEVKVEHVNSKYKVTMTVLELNKIAVAQPGTKSIMEAVAKTCPQILSNLNKIESTSATCTTDTPIQAITLAQEGLSSNAIDKYSCKGKLIDEIERICVNSEFPDFPAGFKKPALYLYPEKDSTVDVKIDLNGVITKSEPTYGKGWKVNVETNGLIEGKYDYLFYEAQLDKLKLPETGWVVEYEELENWFDLNLVKLGLNAKEIQQFTEYWLAELPLANYYEIRLIEDSFLKENMDLVINPQPDTVIRRNFYFKPLDLKISIQAPEIITQDRQGFTAVEWGGVLDQ